MWSAKKLEVLLDAQLGWGWVRGATHNQPARLVITGPDEGILEWTSRDRKGKSLWKFHSTTPWKKCSPSISLPIEECCARGQQEGRTRNEKGRDKSWEQSISNKVWKLLHYTGLGALIPNLETRTWRVTMSRACFIVWEQGDTSWYPNWVSSTGMGRNYLHGGALKGPWREGKSCFPMTLLNILFDPSSGYYQLCHFSFLPSHFVPRANYCAWHILDAQWLKHE